MDLWSETRERRTDIGRQLERMRVRLAPEKEPKQRFHPRLLFAKRLFQRRSRVSEFRLGSPLPHLPLRFHVLPHGRSSCYVKKQAAFELGGVEEVEDGGGNDEGMSWVTKTVVTTVATTSWVTKMVVATVVTTVAATVAATAER